MGSSGKGDMGLIEAVLNPVGYIIPAARKFDPLSSMVAPKVDSMLKTQGPNVIAKQQLAEQQKFAELMAIASGQSPEPQSPLGKKAAVDTKASPNKEVEVEVKAPEAKRADPKRFMKAPSKSLLGDDESDSTFI